MSGQDDKAKRRGAVPLAELIGRVIGPVTARRGFANADLIAAWPDIVGPAYADCTAPEKVTWPRQKTEGHTAGMLVLKVDGPKAIFLQHEVGAIIERVNRYLGFAAIEKIKIIQAPVTTRRPKRAATPESTPPEVEADVEERVAGVESEALRAALARLGRGVLGNR